MKSQMVFVYQVAVCLLCLLKSVEAFQVGRNMMGRSYSMKMMAATAVDKKRVVIVGATGYIGKFVVKEAIRRGWKLVLTVVTSPLIFHKKFAIMFTI
jgi:NADPH:quinone reductase-like Zn-dependent oxidoreductase